MLQTPRADRVRAVLFGKVCAVLRYKGGLYLQTGRILLQIGTIQCGICILFTNQTILRSQVLGRGERGSFVSRQPCIQFLFAVFYDYGIRKDKTSRNND